MNWFERRSELLRWAESLFAPCEVIACWADLPQPQNPKLPVVRLERIAASSVGRESSVLTYDPVAKTVVDTQYTQRMTTLNISLEGTEAQLQAHPATVLEDAALRVPLESRVSKLRELGFGLVGVEPAGIALGRWSMNGRSFPRASFDVRLSYMGSVSDDPIESIETVQAAVEITGEDGLPLPTVTFSAGA